MKRTYKVMFLDHEGCRASATEWFTDGGEISARKWAEDWAYMKADKGTYVLTEITEQGSDSGLEADFDKTGAPF